MMSSHVMKTRDSYDVAVVGGGPAGATAAVWPVLRGEPWWCVAWAAGGTLVVTGLLEPLATRRPGASVPGALAVAAATGPSEAPRSTRLQGATGPPSK